MELRNSKNRNSAEKRHNDYRKALRKQEISKRCYGFDWYRDLHRYSKNKVHCSCPLCRCKTNNRTGKHVWFPATNWSMMDRRRLDEMSDQINEMIIDIPPTTQQEEGERI